jgi:hypothetical protein
MDASNEELLSIEAHKFIDQSAFLVEAVVYTDALRSATTIAARLLEHPLGPDTDPTLLAPDTIEFRKCMESACAALLRLIMLTHDVEGKA